MNIIKLLESFNFGDSPELSKTTSRRESFSIFGDAGKKIALASVPLSLLTLMPNRSQAGTTATSATSALAITDVLNFALTLEYLEREFYTTAISSNVIPAVDRAVFEQIKKHEVAHVTFLINAINTSGGTPVNKPVFDFTAKGAFKPFTVYADFLALAQAFEDTGVRAYKGQAGNLISSDAVLTAALQIHSVEARHACEVRRIRRKNGLDAGNKGWISANSRGTLPAATQGVYDGEENVTHGGVNAITITTVGIAAVQEAFDEPLLETQVNAIASLFIV